MYQRDYEPTPAPKVKKQSLSVKQEVKDEVKNDVKDAVNEEPIDEILTNENSLETPVIPGQKENSHAETKDSAWSLQNSSSTEVYCPVKVELLDDVNEPVTTT